MTGTIVVHKDSVLARSSRHFSITPLLQEKILLVGQEVVYSKASELIATLNQVDVTAKQIDRVCNYYGGLLHQAELHQRQAPTTGRSQKTPAAAETEDKSKAEPGIKISTSFDHLRSLSRPGTDTTADVLYVMMDGSYLQFRNQDDSHKDIWKEIKIGRVFFASHQVKEVSKKRNVIRYSDYV
ncbi:MAG: hypothetical protein ACREHG_09855, partial [Candidatus Saccharimonadales bacterium]